MRLQHTEEILNRVRVVLVRDNVEQIIVLEDKLLDIWVAMTACIIQEYHFTILSNSHMVFQELYQPHTINSPTLIYIIANTPHR